MSTPLCLHGVVIDAFFEDSDDPEAENGLAIVVRPDGPVDRLDEFVGQQITIEVD